MPQNIFKIQPHVLDAMIKKGIGMLLLHKQHGINTDKVIKWWSEYMLSKRPLINNNNNPEGRKYPSNIHLNKLV